MSAMKATLSHALQEEDFAKTIPLATRWTQGVQDACNERKLDWHVQQLGCRAEYWFCTPPVNGAQAAGAVDPMLESFLHLFCLNRGVLLAPFHNMALMSPFHSEADVDKHTEVFSLALEAIV
jgi:glutamate-1-semialdehyde 2,1-aminomutase